MVQLTHPWFLAGMTAAAVPFVLHLMRREVVRNLVFPSIRFILKGRVPQGGRRRLRDLLLLLLRMAACLLLALLLAAPFRPLPAPLPGETDTANILLLDLSASMSVPAKIKQAKTVIRALAGQRAKQPWILIRSANGMVGKPQVLADAGQFDQVVDTLAAGTAAGNHREALIQAISLLQRQPGGSLHIISDFQASDWDPGSLPGLPPGHPLFLHPVDMPRQNLGVVSARFRNPGENAASLLVEIRNFGRAKETARLELAAGAAAESATTEVPPGKTVKLLLPVREKTGSIGQLRLEDDEYPSDNDYHVWLGEPKPRLLLAVYNTQQPGLAATEVFFLEKALSVETEQAGATFTIQRVDAATFFALNLDSIDGLLLLGATGTFDDAGFEKVKQYLETGGTVLCTPHEDHPGRQFIGLRKHRLLTAEYKGVVTERPAGGGPPAVDFASELTAVGRLFANMNHSDLYLFPIRRMLHIVTHPPARDVLRTQDGLPFLTRQRTGTGMFYFFALPLATRWSDLPVSMSFLPMVHEIFGEGTDTADQGILRLDCGQPIPNRKTLTGDNLDMAELSNWDNTGFDAPPRAGKIGLLPVEINVSRKESSLTSRPLAAIRAALTGDTDAEAPPAVSPSEPRRQDLRPHTAMLLLLVVLSHAALAANRDRQENPSLINS